MRSLGYTCVFILGLILSACDRIGSSAEIWYTWRGPGGNEIRALNPTTNQVRVIIHLNRGEFLDDASLSPDGRKILYIAYPDPNKRPDAWLMNSDGSNPVQVPLNFEEKGFVWLDNKRILFAGLKDDWTAYPDDPFL